MTDLITTPLNTFLDSREFYEMMQAYRHAPIDAKIQFDAVKSALIQSSTQPVQLKETE